MPSIEVLVEKPLFRFAVDPGAYDFAVRTSAPPSSHREPSIWQDFFSQTGGLLIHLGEARFKDIKGGWFFAYDLIDEQPRAGYFRFKPECFDQVLHLLEKLLSLSESHRIHFTSDWQFGPKRPIVYRKQLRLPEFFEQHRKSGIRFNSRISIVELRGSK